MSKLQSLAEETVADVHARHSTALPSATAWVMGTINQKNVFSPLDGSVPEDIGERFTGIYERLERSAEGRYFPWLAEGFGAVRERPLDELQRWKMEIKPESSTAKKGT